MLGFLAGSNIRFEACPMDKNNKIVGIATRINKKESWYYGFVDVTELEADIEQIRKSQLEERLKR